MTLIIGLLARDRIIIGADGLEMLQTQSGFTPNSVDCNKLIALPQRRVVIALSGANRYLIPETNPPQFQLLSHTLEGLKSYFAGLQTITEIANGLKQILETNIVATHTHVQQTTGMMQETRITIFGFDQNGRTPQALEQTWFNGLYQGMLSKTDSQGNLKLWYDGSGQPFVNKLVTTKNSKYYVNNTPNMKNHELDDFVKKLYNAACIAQEKAEPDKSKHTFGGNYTQYTMTTKQMYMEREIKVDQAP